MYENESSTLSIVAIMNWVDTLLCVDVTHHETGHVILEEDNMAVFIVNNSFYKIIVIDAATRENF